jgi:hypothetical protein
VGILFSGKDSSGSPEIFTIESLRFDTLKLELTAPCDGTGVTVTPGICVELTPCDVVEVGEDVAVGPCEGVAVGLGVVLVQPSTSTDAQIVNSKRINKIFLSI